MPLSSLKAVKLEHHYPDFNPCTLHRIGTVHYRWTDGWKDGRMDGWMDGWMDPFFLYWEGLIVGGCKCAGADDDWL